MILLEDKYLEIYEKVIQHNSEFSQYEEIIKEILPLQMGDKEHIDVAMQDVERDPITELAKELANRRY